MEKDILEEKVEKKPVTKKPVYKKPVAKKVEKENKKIKDLEEKFETMQKELQDSFKITGIMASITYPIEDKSITLGIESSAVNDPIAGHEKLFLELMNSMMNIANIMGEE